MTDRDGLELELIGDANTEFCAGESCVIPEAPAEEI